MIVVYGDAIVDLFAWPRGSDLATAEQFVPRQGGAPANVAVVASRLGASVRFVGAIGRDAHGERVRNALERAGVDTQTVVTLAQRTGVTFVRVGLDGTRAFLSYRAGGADFALTREDLESLPLAPLENARWVQMMSSALASQPGETATRWILSERERRGVSLSVDLNVRPHLWSNEMAMHREVRSLGAVADLVKASEEDLVALGLPATLESLRSLCRRPGSVALLTLAERGAIASIGNEVVHVPSPHVAVVDATGAGDAFMGTVLAALVASGTSPATAGWNDVRIWEARLRLACRVGARAVTELGATDALVDLADEREEIQRSAP